MPNCALIVDEGFEIVVEGGKMRKCKICGKTMILDTPIVYMDGTGVCSENCAHVYEIQSRYEQKTKHDNMLREKYGDLFLNIVDTIKTFKPLLSNYEEELLYHIDLARWLQQKFPMLQVEHQRGSSRPDIVIEDIAIEIKGPTYEIGLQSIADKCLRYHQHFKKMIVVLFDIRIKTKRFYNEWEDGLKKYFPDVIVIKK